MDRRRQLTRDAVGTVKSCGSGAATLASSLWSNPLMTVANKAAHREEHEVRRKAIAWGMSECSPLNLYASVPFLAQWHTRPRVQRALRHPRALCFQEGQRDCKTRAKNKPRE